MENDNENQSEETKPEKATEAIVLTPAEKKQKIEIEKYKTESTDVMNPTVYKQLKLMARDFVEAGAIPSGFKNAEQVFVAMMAGREMGMMPYESLQSLYLVNGNLSIYGKATIRRVRNFGYQVEYIDETENSTTARVWNDKTEYKETYTFEQAVKSGYTTGSTGMKFGWKEGVNRKLKLRYGALSMIIRTYIPEVFGSAMGIVEVDEDVDTKSSPVILIDDHKDKLNEAKSGSELARIWSTLPAEAKSNAEIVELKDQLKIKLAHNHEMPQQEAKNEGN